MKQIEKLSHKWLISSICIVFVLVITWQLSGCSELVNPDDSPQQTENICITFIQRRSNVFDVGPTLYKCYTNIFYLLGVPVGGGFPRVVIHFTDRKATDQGLASVQFALLPRPLFAIKNRNNVLGKTIITPAVNVAWAETPEAPSGTIVAFIMCF